MRETQNIWIPFRIQIVPLSIMVRDALISIFGTFHPRKYLNLKNLRLGGTSDNGKRDHKYKKNILLHKPEILEAELICWLHLLNLS